MTIRSCSVSGRTFSLSIPRKQDAARHFFPNSILYTQWSTKTSLRVCPDDGIQCQTRLCQFYRKQSSDKLNFAQRCYSTVPTEQPADICRLRSLSIFGITFPVSWSALSSTSFVLRFCKNVAPKKTTFRVVRRTSAIPADFCRCGRHPPDRLAQSKPKDLQTLGMPSPELLRHVLSTLHCKLLVQIQVSLANITVQMLYSNKGF